MLLLYNQQGRGKDGLSKEQLEAIDKAVSELERQQGIQVDFR